MSPRKEFEVLMYESEYRQIQAWVDKYQHLETGGDLFGLWADDHTAVVQLVLGPGKGCRRSSVSFYQDVEYLDRVGNLLTHEEGLCHIGEWHSHHRLGLTRPSGGDENTVWTNMDRYGIHRFFLFIATIDYDVVNVGCFLFEIDSKTEKRKDVLKGRVTQISNIVESPFRVKVGPALAKGAETQNSSKSLKKFAPKNAKIELESRNNTDVSTRYHNECPTTNTPVHEERENRERAKQQESRDRCKNIEENPIEIQNNIVIEQNHYKVLDNQEPEMPKSIQKENSKMDELPVIHIDRNKAETIQNQPLISQINNEGDIKQNESTSSVQSTQGYNKINDQTNIKTSNNRDKPNDEDDQVQLTFLENLPKKEMDATCQEIRSVTKSTVTYVESVKSSDLKTTNQRNQTHKPNTLDQGQVSLRKETSKCESQQNSKHESITVLEIENKGDQPKERKRSSQICSGIEEENIQYEPSSSVPDQDLGGEDELTVKCWPGRKQKKEKEKKKKEKEKKKKEKEKKKKEKEKKKKEKEEKKKEKEARKKEKEARKKEEKEAKKDEKGKKKKQITR